MNYGRRLTLCLLALVAAALAPAWPAAGQMTVQQPFFAAPSASQPDFQLPSASSIFVDLDDADLANGQISTWYSRTNPAITFTNFSSQGPIKEATGLKFFGTNWVQMTNMVSSTPFTSRNAFFVVFNNSSPSASAWKTVIGAIGMERGLMLKAKDITPFFVADIPMSSDLQSNVWFSVVYLGGTNTGCFTNGVYSGSYGYEDASGWGWAAVGKNQAHAGSDRWWGHIRKIVWWTNTAEICLTTNDAIALHNWAVTNKFQ